MRKELQERLPPKGVTSLLECLLPTRNPESETLKAPITPKKTLVCILTGTLFEAVRRAFLPSELAVPGLLSLVF